MKIKGYTLHGDYYLANDITPCKNWKEACEMKEEITLPNGKKVVAHILSKDELRSIPKEQRAIEHYWYWTSTPVVGGNAWSVSYGGYFYYFGVYGSYGNGGARLGFHKNEIKQILDIE